jgi:hypothetical protein
MDTVVIGLMIIAAAVGFLLWEGRPFGAAAEAVDHRETERSRSAESSEALGTRAAPV